jgi:hypothetical protein
MAPLFSISPTQVSYQIPEHPWPGVAGPSYAKHRRDDLQHRIRERPVAASASAAALAALQ